MVLFDFHNLAIDKLNAQISQKDMVIIKAQKCYQEISKFASTENGQIDEDHYQQTLLKILKTFFIDQHFDLRFDEVCENDFNEEEALDFKWVKHHENCILNLNKPTPKTHQYRMYFRNLDISRSSEYKDIVHVVRLVVNILAWIKTLKGLNSMVMNDEVIPLRQDCKTLTIVNNVRSILEDVSNNEASVENIDRFCFNPRELQAFLQNVCHRVFLALHIETECTIMLDQDSVENSNETEVPEINKKLGADGKYKVPFGEHKNAQTYTTESNDIDIASTHEMIVIKCENIIVEAKVISTCTMAEDMKEFCQTFNPTEQSKLDDYDEDIPINETTKKFIFRLLKNFIETFYSKVFAQKEILIKEDDMSNKLSEYENELRILKDWNQFILLNMNRHNVMDNFENWVIAVEKYLIWEIAKSTDVEDISIYYTYDYQTLLKIRNSKEVISEEIAEILTDKILTNLESDRVLNSDQSMTKCVSILCDDMQHYFVIKTDMAVPDKVSFIVKIEYKQEQEGVVTTNTLQILSNVFLQTLSHFLNQYYNESYSVSRNEVLQSLLQNQSISQKHWK